MSMIPLNKSESGLHCPGFAVTVIIPTFNRAQALICCLEHLERQSCQDFEVVVVDDGSTDETAARVEEYEKRTTLNLKFIRQSNGGPARARNVAVAAASSPLALMIGDDIFPTPQFVEAHLKLHRQHPEPQVAALGLTVWEEKMQEVTPFMRFLEEGIQFSYSDLTAGKISTRYFYTSNLSVKTELLRRNPFCERFPAAAFEDLELGVRLTKTEGLELIFIPEALASHYHPTSFVQACKRMRNGGWSAHLMYEMWPDTYLNPAGATRVRRLVRKVLAPAPILFAVTQFTALLTRFITPKALFRAVLGTYFYVGYKQRELEVAAEKNSSKLPSVLVNR